jgi:predicted deacetylase
MIPTPAQYLLRFDDLCPTYSTERWQRCLRLVEEFRIRPILAVVPDNQDPQLAISEPDPEFWPQMQALEASGATIALHGYRHLCQSAGRSLLPLHSKTEFAGVPEEIQHQWIRSGLEILRSHGLNPRVWVAPRHGFDRATLRALRHEGITILSDGFARVPFVRDGMTWIPQQIWGPMEKPKGLWTTCMHSNSARSEQVDELQSFLRLHAHQFTTVDRVLAELQPGKLGLAERLRTGFISNYKYLQYNRLKI